MTTATDTTKPDPVFVVLDALRELAADRGLDLAIPAVTAVPLPGEPVSEQPPLSDAALREQQRADYTWIHHELMVQPGRQMQLRGRWIGVLKQSIIGYGSDFKLTQLDVERVHGKTAAAQALFLPYKVNTPEAWEIWSATAARLGIELEE
jgi:hypothetical protein